MLLYISLSSFQGPADIPPLDSRCTLRGPHKMFKLGRFILRLERICALVHTPGLLEAFKCWTRTNINYLVTKFKLAVTFATGAALLELLPKPCSGLTS